MMAMVYQFRTGQAFGIEAQLAGEALERIGNGNLGTLKPQEVVDAARPPDHPLHPVFEWDDRTAAEAHRRQQARHLIGAIVTVMPESRSGEPVRAFVNVNRGSDQQAYVPIRAAMEDEELRQQTLAQATRELVAWRQRYREFEELASLFTQIDWIEEQRRAKEN